MVNIPERGIGLELLSDGSGDGTGATTAGAGGAGEERPVTSFNSKAQSLMSAFQSFFWTASRHRPLGSYPTPSRSSPRSAYSARTDADPRILSSLPTTQRLSQRVGVRSDDEATHSFPISTTLL